jgi:hypothetical protein
MSNPNPSPEALPSEWAELAARALNHFRAADPADILRAIARAREAGLSLDDLHGMAGPSGRFADATPFQLTFGDHTLGPFWIVTAAEATRYPATPARSAGESA